MEASEMRPIDVFTDAREGLSINGTPHWVDASRIGGIVAEGSMCVGHATSDGWTVGYALWGPWFIRS